MKRISIAMCLALLVGFGATNVFAQGPLEQQVLISQDRAHSALLNRNIAELTLLIADDYQSSGGAVGFDKNILINEVASGNLKYSVIYGYDRVVTLSADGQTATVTGRKNQIGTFGGGGIDISGNYPFVSTYINVGGGNWAVTSTAALAPCDLPHNN